MIEKQLENIHRVVPYSDYLLIPLAENNLLKLRTRKHNLLALRLLAYLLNVIHFIYHMSVINVYYLQLAGFP